MSDIRVQPLWEYLVYLGRYWARAQDGPAWPAEAVRLLSVADIRTEGQPSRQEEEAARGFVQLIMEKVARQRPTANVEWNEGGNAVYEQPNLLHPILAFARWLDYRDLLPEFELDTAFDTHPVWRTSHAHPRAAVCELLAEHGCTAGLMVPVPFTGVVTIKDDDSNHPLQPILTGSTVQLCQEVDMLHRKLNIPDPYVFDPADPWQRVHESFDQLRTVARLSLAHELPIIFGL